MEESIQEWRNRRSCPQKDRFGESSQKNPQSRGRFNPIYAKDLSFWSRPYQHVPWAIPPDQNLREQSTLGACQVWNESPSAEYTDTLARTETKLYEKVERSHRTDEQEFYHCLDYTDDANLTGQ